MGHGGWDELAIAWRGTGGHASPEMDHPARAERLPELYRAILDAVSELEHQGQRLEARHIRLRATRAYATWDERAERRLTAILEDARRTIDPSARPERSRGRLRAWLAQRRRAGSSSLVQPST